MMIMNPKILNLMVNQIKMKQPQMTKILTLLVIKQRNKVTNQKVLKKNKRLNTKQRTQFKNFSLLTIVQFVCLKNFLKISLMPERM